MTITAVRTARPAARRAILALAVLAYLPLVLSERGRLPADTKLGLTLDPVRLMSDALRSWDTGQFAGWVPHQSISYLWPSGPFYAALTGLGVPEWLTQRLWAGTVLFAAGTGVWWFIRRRGYSVSAALVAAVIYQTTPYILPYLSRTSLMLMPWAALGWLLALTDRAVFADRDWKRPTALFGLVVGTALGINLTAAVMIAPAPVIHLALLAIQRRTTWRRALVTTLRLGVASVITSAWWLVMLLMQGRYGAEVLGYSETLEAVSSTSSAPEVLRGLGYWLNYIHAPSGITTSAATRYMTNPRLIAVGMLLLTVVLVAFVMVRFAEKVLAAALLLTGLVLAVGPHPIDDASPLMSPLADATRSTLALSFRSSTRAIPLIVLALALCGAALVDASARHRSSARSVVAPALLVLALANQPALFIGPMVDPQLLHDQRPPAEWYRAAAVLDAAGSETRVLQLPGVESQVFNWGYTVDPPLAMLTDRPLITRDWLPLGTPAAMDLLYAFDDRFQNGTIDPAAVAPISRLLGVGTVWLALDANATRFSSTTPDAAASILDIAPDVRRTAVDGQHVRLYDILEPVSIARAATQVVVVFGSGDGLVDAAAAGLLTGRESVLYAADLSDEQLADLAARGATFLLTDSNRDRARQWRGAQDVWGFTEVGGPDDDLLVADPQDNRLPVFAEGRGLAPTDQTTATLADGLTVQASHYGSQIALRPEHRPAMAVDGDPATGWVVGLDVTPIIGESIRLSSAPDGLQLRQIDGGHEITSIAIDTAESRSVIALDERSHTAPGQPVTIDTDGPVTITILAIRSNDAAFAARPASVGAGFAELLPEAHLETVNTPSLRSTAIPEGRFAMVLTRLRTEKTQRLDPEPVLRRSFESPAVGTPSWNVQVRAVDLGSIDAGCRTDLLLLDGQPLPLRIDSDTAASLNAGKPAWVTPCEAAAPLRAGSHTLSSIPGSTSGLDVDAVSIESPHDAIDSIDSIGYVTPVVTIERDVDDHTLHVSQCPNGCWVVFGEGFSTGWSATSDDATVGAHQSIDGGFNGWWVEPSTNDGTATLQVHWAAQRPVMIGLAVSAVGGLAFVVLGLRRRGRAGGPPLTDDAPTTGAWRDTAPWQQQLVTGTAAIAAVALAVDVKWAAALVPVIAISLVLRRRSYFATVGLLGLAASAASFVFTARRDRPPPSFVWPSHFADLHRPMMTAVVVLTVGAIASVLDRRAH